MATNSITLDTVVDKGKSILEATEQSLQTTINNLGTSPSVSEMLVVQQNAGKFTVVSSVLSTLSKEIKDTLKEVIQKV